MIYHKKPAASGLFFLACLSAWPVFSAGRASSVPEPSSSFLSNAGAFLKQGHPVLAVGGYWGDAGKTQHINIQGLIGNTYRPNHQDRGNALVGVGYLLDGPTVRAEQLNYGLNWFYLPRVRYSGTVTQENLFTNLSYRYSLTHYPLYAMLKSTLPMAQRFPQYQFTADAGIGPDFMQTSRYQETPINNNSQPNPPFLGKTTTTFSATVGLALKRQRVFGSLPLECGYRFFYLGEGRFGRNSNQLNTFTTGPAYANALLCSMTI